MGTQGCSQQEFWPMHVLGYSQFDTPCEFGSCGTGPVAGTSEFGWTISASNTDPYVQTGRLETPLARLYVWYVCASGEQAYRAIFGVENTDPNLSLLQIGMAQFSVWLLAPQPFGSTDVDAYSGNCSPAPLIVLQLLYINTTPVSVDAQSGGGVKSLYR
jgi:hypothetical protein